jgi:tetratricopeptide (TPR) repeat protein
MGGRQRRPTRPQALGLPGRSWVFWVIVALVAACGRDGAAIDRLVEEGVERARSGDHAGALARFDRALATDPDHPAALVNGGLAALLESRPADARVRLERYLEFHPDAVLPRVYLAHALIALEDREGALAALQHAVGNGFRDLDTFSHESFSSLRNDLRFLQLTSLVAQRNGQRAPTDERGRPVFGLAPVRSLSGPGLDPSCGDDDPTTAGARP